MRAKAKPGDVFRTPVGDEHVAYGQVISTIEFTHVVIREGLHPVAADDDLDAAVSGPVVLYAWTQDWSLADGTWPIVGSRPVDPTALPPLEFVEMGEAGEFQVVDYEGAALRPASPEDVQGAPFRSIQPTTSVEYATRAWHGRLPWRDADLGLRPWDERNADRDDEAARLVRRFRS